MKFELFVKEEMPYKITRISFYFYIERKVGYASHFIRKERVVFAANRKKFMKDENNLIFINSRKALEFKKEFLNALNLFEVKGYDFEVNALSEDLIVKNFFKQKYKLEKFEEPKELLTKSSLLVMESALKSNLDKFVLSSERKFLIDLREVYLVFTFGTGIRYTFTSVF